MAAKHAKVKPILQPRGRYLTRTLIYFILKKRGKLCLYINYRAFRRRIRKDYILLPLIIEVLDY